MSSPAPPKESYIYWLPIFIISVVSLGLGIWVVVNHFVEMPTCTYNYEFPVLGTDQSNLDIRRATFAYVPETPGDFTIQIPASTAAFPISLNNKGASGFEPMKFSRSGLNLSIISSTDTPHAPGFSLLGHALYEISIEIEASFTLAHNLHFTLYSDDAFQHIYIPGQSRGGSIRWQSSVTRLVATEKLHYSFKSWFVTNNAATDVFLAVQSATTTAVPFTISALRMQMVYLGTRV